MNERPQRWLNLLAYLGRSKRTEGSPCHVNPLPLRAEVRALAAHQRHGTVHLRLG